MFFFSSEDQRLGIHVRAVPFQTLLKLEGYTLLSAKLCFVLDGPHDAIPVCNSKEHYKQNTHWQL